ncbi:MAG: hypothetical protein PHW49_05055 [Acinetobacter harbinensis]|uniref:hypothetical protein n=1 Tax=Acinetobacter TaxID=469 RepID=UPI00057D7760|nr:MULTISPECIES: hypothetical protein [Acinetobacter]KWQ04816.1 hypothetical protein SE27_05835 [Acinetobacter harbinensis]MBR5557713.1 hypothetical protein [Acinetobacter sp.]MDD2940089.1 hypothetical protein [Acinetobacter harbinensis]
MSDMNDYDEVEETAVDDDEAKAAEKGASDSEVTPTDGDVAEAETLTITAKLKKRQALEDQLAAFLAQGGRIVEVPPDEAARD